MHPIFSRFGSNKPMPSHELPAGTRSGLNRPFGPDPAQCVDLFVPAVGSGRAPLLVLLHGGAWRVGDKAQPEFVSAKRRHWLEQGWAVASLNYRLAPGTSPLDQVADLQAGVQLVRHQLLPDAGMASPSHWVLLGHSAGAHLALLWAAQAAGTAALEHCRALIALDSGALDVPALLAGPHLPVMDEVFGSDPAVWQRLSPLHQLRQRLPPCLLVASRLRPAALAQAEAFMARARQLGGEAELLPLPLPHGEINRRLGLPLPYTAAVDRFLARHMPI